MARLQDLLALQQAPDLNIQSRMPGEGVPQHAAKELAMARYLAPPEEAPAPPPPMPQALARKDAPPPPNNTADFLESQDPAYRGPVPNEPPGGWKPIAKAFSPQGAKPEVDPEAPTPPEHNIWGTLRNFAQAGRGLAAAVTSPHGDTRATINPAGETIKSSLAAIDQNLAHDDAQDEAYKKNLSAYSAKRRADQQAQANLDWEHGFKNKSLEEQAALRKDLVKMRTDAQGERLHETLESQEKRAGAKNQNAVDVAKLRKGARGGASGGGGGAPGQDLLSEVNAAIEALPPEQDAAKVALRTKAKLGASMSKGDKRNTALNGVLGEVNKLIPQEDARADIQERVAYQKEIEPLDMLRGGLERLDPLLEKHKSHPQDMPGVGVVASHVPNAYYGLKATLGIDKAQSQDAMDYRQAQKDIQSLYQLARSGKVLNAAEMKQLETITASADVTPEQMMRVHDMLRAALERQQSNVDSSYPGAAKKFREEKARMAGANHGEAPIIAQGGGGIGGLPPTTQKTGGGPVLGKTVSMRHGKTGETLNVPAEDAPTLEGHDGWEVVR